MKRCKRCDVQVKGVEQFCPLCHCVLSSVTELVPVSESRYPTVTLSLSRYHLLNRIFLFVSIVIIGLSIWINYLFFNGVFWFVTSIAAILYSVTIIRHAIRNSIHVASKIVVQAISGSVLIVIIDVVLGFQGWSVNYIIPQIAILANLAIFILMMINRMDWRNYVLYQMSMGIFGFVPLVLILLKIITRPFAAYVSIGLSAAVLLGTVIFGDKTVKSEMIRRFHI